LRLCKLSAHLAGLTFKSEHLDFGHDLLGEELPGQLQLAVEQFQTLAQSGFLLGDDVDVLNNLARARVEDALLGLDRTRCRFSVVAG